MKKTNDKISYAQLKDLIGENNYNTLKKHKALKRWIRNMKDRENDFTRNYLRGKNEYNFSDFLYSTFLWNISYEGHDFWSEIERKYNMNEN